MDVIAVLLQGASTAITPDNLLYCLLGVTLGTLIGVLPGLGPIPTIAMLLPLTYSLPPVSSLIMLSGIYYGSQYGGSTTAILIKLPGESSSVVTALDGHEMARRGEAGKALAVAALGSFFAGSVTVLLLAVVAAPLAEVALSFSSTEYFALMLLGLVASITLASGSVYKALGMVLLGLLLGLIGRDTLTGGARLTFGIDALSDGVDFVAIAMGVFGIAEIIRNLETETTREAVAAKVGKLWLSLADFRRIAWPVLRGTGLGAALGILPGGGAMISSFASYALEKRLARDPSRFGKGAIEGVAGPESANNAGAQASFIPMLTLGIPSNPVMALMIGALIIQGITPGPNIVTDRPELFWGLVVSMWVGNLMLLVLNLPMIGIWVKVLKVPYKLMVPIITTICCVGMFTIESNVADIYIMAAFGLLGYVLLRLRFEPAPLLLGFIVGPLMEEHFRRAMLLSNGDPTVFVTRPISAVLVGLTVLILLLMLIPSVKKVQAEAVQEVA
jgi:putative tricarboxylic transport membrane protein